MIIGEKYRKRLESINKEADAFRVAVLNRVAYWKKSTAEERAKIEKEIVIKKKKYNQIVDDYIRLSLDSFLYYGLIESICKKLSPEQSTEEQKERYRLYVELRSRYTNTLLKPVKEKREAFIEALRVIPNWTNEEQLGQKSERLKSQQIMIKNSWSTWE